MTVTSDRDALFRAICANPEDDTPRLAFADWLDENDDPARAEFVRAQVEFARLAADGSDSQAVWEFLKEQDYVTLPAARWELIDSGIARRAALDARIAGLWQEHGPAWRAELPQDCGVIWTAFHRGFAGRAEVTDYRLLAASAGRLAASVPSVELVCRGLGADDARRLAEAGLFPWVRGLKLLGDYADGLLALGQDPRVGGVSGLAVRRGDGADGVRVAEAVAGSPHWGGLRTLDLKGTWCTSTAAEVLFRAAHLRGLTRLDVDGGNWTADTVRAFVETGFPRLTDLRFPRTRLQNDAAEVLAAAPPLAAVRHLDLGHNLITGRGATALLCSPHLSGVAFLGLDHNPVARLDRPALADAPAGGLRMLHCHGCRLTVGDVRAVVRSPRVRDLWYLDLDDNGLAPGAVREIVRGFKRRCPPVVWLTGNRIDDRGAAALADWPAAAGLRVLQLYDNPLTDAGIRSLLDSPHLANLDGFGVSAPTEATRRAVEERFGDHGLTKRAAPGWGSGPPLA